jgi:hypothetical protein
MLIGGWDAAAEEEKTRDAGVEAKVLSSHYNRSEAWMHAGIELIFYSGLFT